MNINWDDCKTPRSIGCPNCGHYKCESNEYKCDEPSKCSYCGFVENGPTDEELSVEFEEYQKLKEELDQEEKNYYDGFAASQSEEEPSRYTIGCYANGPRPGINHGFASLYDCVLLGSDDPNYERDFENQIFHGCLFAPRHEYNVVPVGELEEMLSLLSGDLSYDSVAKTKEKLRAIINSNINTFPKYQGENK